jgi:hypothetical protein
MLGVPYEIAKTRKLVFTKPVPRAFFNTGTARPSARKAPEQMFVQIASRALDSKLDYRAAEAHSRSIGPRKVKIGALPAEQGGYELNYPTHDDRPVKTYSVFTGRGGERDSMALPDLSVEMESYVPEQTPEVTADPPPLEQSMQRLEAFLAGFRLRTTEPPLPELKQLEE